jgi:hypothetical protein
MVPRFGAGFFGACHIDLAEANRSTRQQAAGAR